FVHGVLAFPFASTTSAVGTDLRVPLPRADAEDDARSPDDRVLRIGRAVHEIPLAQRSLSTLDDQGRGAGEDQEILLVTLPVVHRHRPASSEDRQPDSELVEED